MVVFAEGWGRYFQGRLCMADNACWVMAQLQLVLGYWSGTPWCNPHDAARGVILRREARQGPIFIAYGAPRPLPLRLRRRELQEARQTHLLRDRHGTIRSFQLRLRRLERAYSLCHIHFLKIAQLQSQGGGDAFLAA